VPGVVWTGINLKILAQDLLSGNAGTNEKSLGKLTGMLTGTAHWTNFIGQGIVLL
jgi:hypothetical protein